MKLLTTTDSRYFVISIQCYLDRWWSCFSSV